jgi:transcriptional regulator with XRE-family HTH domain
MMTVTMLVYPKRTCAPTMAPLQECKRMARDEVRLIKQFGSRLRKLRVGKSLTQQRLAERCGLSTTYVSECERGVRNPSLATCYRLARRGLGESLASLLFGVGETGIEDLTDEVSRLDSIIAGFQRQKQKRVLRGVALLVADQDR